MNDRLCIEIAKKVGGVFLLTINYALTLIEIKRRLSPIIFKNLDRF